MGLLRDLRNDVPISDRTTRQLRLAGVQTAEELYAFLVAFPELVEGEERSTWSTRDAAQVWRQARGAPTGLRASAVAAQQPPLPTGGFADVYGQALQWAQDRCDPAFLQISTPPGVPAPAHGLGVVIPEGKRLALGEAVPYAVLDAPVRRKRRHGDGWRIEIDVTLSGKPPFIDVDVEVHPGRKGDAPTSSGSGEEGAGPAWDDAVVAMSPLGPDVRLDLPEGWPARDQRLRGTCTAFAVVASVEVLEAGGAAAPDLSEQYAFNRFVGWSADGGSLSSFDLLAGGVCDEAALAYTVDPSPDGFDAIADSQLRKYKRSYQRVAGAAEVYAQLARGRAVAIALPVFAPPAGNVTNWTTDVGRAYGRVLGAPAGARLVGGHAVCVVGYQQDDRGGVGADPADARRGDAGLADVGTQPFAGRPRGARAAREFGRDHCTDVVPVRRIGRARIPEPDHKPA